MESNPGTLPPVAGATDANGDPLTTERVASGRSASTSLRRGPRASERAGAIYTDFAKDDGRLDVSSLEALLTALDISCAPDTYKRLVASVAGPSAGSITKDQTLAVVGMLTADPNQVLAGGPSGLSRVDSASGPGTPSGAGGGGASFAALEREASTSSPAKPFRRLITKNRAYLETGSLHVDEAVVAYMAKLEEHRRRCEAEGRYQEAKVATKRLADLRTAQVEKLRQELAANQTRELEEVQGVYEEETAKFHHIWDGRMRDYAANLAKATEDLRASHTSQLAAFVEELQKKRPTRARPSRDYLLQREMQDKLAKSQQYSRATKVKTMADELYQAELETTVAAWEAESKLKIAKLQAKQQTEFEALLQRGTKGRDELELKRVAETERRTLRFRNIVSELEQLHKVEMAHLENFLDGQVLAGKATPLRDPGAFRRKREQLFSLAI